MIGSAPPRAEPGAMQVAGSVGVTGAPTSDQSPPADGAVAPERWVATACVGLLAVLAGLEWHRVFGWGAVTWRVVLAAAVPVLLTALFRNRPVPRPGAAALLSLVGLFWYGVVAAVGGSVALVLPSAGGLHGVVDGLVNGWARVLSVPLPVPAQGSSLVLPVAVTWLAAWLGTMIVLATRRPLAGVVPPALGYALTLLFGIGSPGSRLVTSSAFVAVTLVLAGATARPLVAGRFRDRVVRRRAVAEITGGLVVVTAVAALLGPSLPGVGGHPYDPRTSRVPPESPASAMDPLDQLSVWAQHPDGPALMTVTWSGPPQTERLAVLDHYDPLDGWTATNRFESAGATLPAARRPGQAVRRVTVRQQVRLDSLPGPWLPAADRPVAIQGARALVDPTTGVLLSAKGARHARYRVTSVVPTKDCTLDAAVPFGPGGGPSVPSAIAALAAKDTAGATSPCARAAALAKAFGQYTFSAKAPSGSNLAAIENFLFGPKDQGGGTGTYEQVAAAYALMAESLGMRARVVVGLHAGQPVGHGRYVVRPKDAFAWVELDFVGAGWVPFYPSPVNGPTPPADKTDQASSNLKTNPDQTTPTGGQPREVATPAQLHRGGSTGLVVAGVGLGVVVGAALVLLALVALAVGAGRRRRGGGRRGAADDRRRVIGAWEESLDHLVAVGVRRKSSATAGEVVAEGVDRLGQDGAVRLVPLADLANAARYAPEPPDPSDADTAWLHASALSSAVRGALGRRDRIRRALDVRVLRPPRPG